MKINELLMNIHNKEFNLERALQVKKYLPIEVKKAIAQSIIYECTENENGVIKVDSVQRYLSYVKYMITMHTNLEYSDENYDALCSKEYGDTTLLNAIVNMFESDANECNRILDLMMDDYMQEMSVDFAVAQFLGKLNYELSNLSNQISAKISELNIEPIIPDGIDANKLNNFLQNYIK